MLAAGDDFETILAGYPWLEREDLQACLLYARRQIGNERIELLNIEAGALSETPLGRVRLGRRG